MWVAVTSIGLGIKFQVGLAVIASNDFDFSPSKLSSEPASQRLGRSLFCGPSGGESRGQVGAIACIRQLYGGEEALKKELVLEMLVESRDLNDVHSDS